VAGIQCTPYRHGKRSESSDARSTANFTARVLGYVGICVQDGGEGDIEPKTESVFTRLEGLALCRTGVGRATITNPEFPWPTQPGTQLARLAPWPPLAP
jgi:hypothetical protein